MLTWAEEQQPITHHLFTKHISSLLLSEEIDVSGMNSEFHMYKNIT